MTFPKEKLSYRRKQDYISVYLENYLEIEDKVVVKRSILSFKQLFLGAKGEKKLFIRTA